MSMFVVAPAAPGYHSYHHHHHDSLPDQQGIGVGMIPLLASASANEVEDVQDLLSGRREKPNFGGLHQLWHGQTAAPIYNTGKAVSITNSTHPSFVLHGGSGNASGGTGASNNSGTSSGVGGSSTCQDCGNQAKKDCSHRRCRTCCKSRGFDCDTHVKSTWVPAARRRERQLIVAAGGTPSTGGAAGSSGSTSHGVKKPRLVASQGTASHTSTSNNTATPPRSFDTGSSHQDTGFKESLPGHVRANAVFKCVRVTAMDDDEDQYAYQATVKIGGHVFKGFLYDEGLENKESFPNLSELHLGGASRNLHPSNPIMDPADVYASYNVQNIH